MRVAVIGAGYSGAMAAVELARLGKTEILLIERRGEFAAGAAYSTRDPSHFLNVRARNMSAFADAPDHFADWAGREGLGGPDDFMRRMDYRRYLGELLAEAERGGAISRVQDEAVALEEVDGGIELTLASGGRIGAQAALLAGGNYPSSLLARYDLPPDRVIDDPWSVEGLAAVARVAAQLDDILILGTGLTMVDVCLSLDQAGYRGRILATSRRGLVPRAQEKVGAEHLPCPPGARLSILLRAVRNLSKEEGWRPAVDSLRPRTIEIWRGLSDAEQSRFLRHLRPWWDVHRHRIAPSVAERLEGLRAEGRLEVMAGRMTGVTELGDAAEVTIARRGGGAETRRVAALINCTGPEGAIRRVADPLIAGLLASGAARPDPLGIGLDVDENSRIIGADGRPSSAIHALGPLTRGAFWEIVAVPDIRGQVRDVARRLQGPDPKAY